VSSFALWNDRLRDHFFCGANCGRTVRLTITRNLLDDEFEDIGGSEGFEKAVHHGPNWPTGYDEDHHDHFLQKDLYDRALGMHRAWSKPWTKPREYVLPPDSEWWRVPPPYLPYLCLFSYAWTLEEDEDGEYLQGNNYFDRLELCYPEHGLNTLNWTEPLWDGLKAWANGPKRMAGSLGMFQPLPLGRGPKWVNIAKGQVLLTAARTRHLPALFDHLRLIPGYNYTTDALKERMRQHDTIVQQTLGRTLAGIAIDEKMPGHQDVLQVLIEHFQEWDGYSLEPVTAVTSDSLAGQDPGNTQKSGMMLLVLSPKEENDEWEAFVTLESESIPPGIVELEYDKRKWTCRQGNATCSRFSRNENAQAVYLKGELITNPDRNWTVAAQWTDKEVGTLPVMLQHIEAQVRFLQWDGPNLVERRGRPAAGVVYCLIHDKIAGRWATWRSGLHNGQVVPVGGRSGRCLGLPAGWTLWYILATERVPEDSWDSFPERSGRPPVTRLLRLRGGSLLRSLTRRTYLPFDLPHIVLDDSDDTRLEVTGGAVELVPACSRLRWTTSLPATPIRTYRLQSEEETSIIRIDAIRGDTRLDRIQVRVSREPGAIPHIDSTQFRLDRFGTPAPDGAVGADIPTTGYSESGWVAPKQDGWYNPTNQPDERALEYLEWLANLGRRTPYSKVRDFLAERDEEINPAYEIKALAQLAHLELETDPRGRWAYVHPLPCCLYALPTLRNGQHQAVVSGVYTREKRDALCRSAERHGLTLLTTEQLGGGDRSPLHFVPRQRLLLSREPQLFREIAREVNLIWHSDPPAVRLAAWAGGLDDWERGLTWRRDPGFRSAHVYDSRRFRTVSFTSGGDGLTYSLQRVTDRLTDRHVLYQIRRSDGNEFRFASVDQKAWGCWLVQQEAWRRKLRLQNSAAPVPIYYDQEVGSLTFPLELEPPLLLARALVLCSGYAPSYVRLAITGPRLLLDLKEPYLGICVEYEFIPIDLAKAILSRLGAAPVELIRAAYHKNVFSSYHRVREIS
jgi:hypothetical protein